MSQPDWLHELAESDQCTPHESAAALSECGVSVALGDWLSLSTAGRAVILTVRRELAARALEAEGLDLRAAMSRESVDHGVSAARLLAESAGRGTLAALRTARKRGRNG